MTDLATYLPQDRCRALAAGTTLPDYTTGAVLFADLSGFTPLTETLRTVLGARRGAEALTQHLDAVYTALIAEVERMGGSVVNFAGDAITCWFDDLDGPSAPRAALCALTMQSVMQAFAALALPNGHTATLSLKVAVATGPVRRFLIGVPEQQLLDILAGDTVARTAHAEQIAQKGEVLVDEATLHMLGATARVQAWRTEPESGRRFAVLVEYSALDVSSSLTPPPPLAPALIRQYLLPAVYAREQAGQSTFLTEFRPCVALFVCFTGIMYDAPEAAAQLDAFVRRVQASAARYDVGLLNLTIGDKGSYLYLALGALSTHEDDARRAVRIALEVQEATRTLAFLAPVQIGISQGILRVGTYGGPTRRTYSALGDEVNVAARLMQAAAPGEILVSGTLHKVLAAAFNLEPRVALRLKGKAEPVAVYVVSDTRRPQQVHLQEPVYALPMVGRQAELERVHVQLAAVRAGQAQLIGLVAEAGMGKSRLIAEILQTARAQKFQCYGGACQSDARDTPYQVWKAVWSAFFEHDATQPNAEPARALENARQYLAPMRWPALPLLEPLLNCDIPESAFTQALEPRYRQSTLHALLSECLQAAARHAPILIILEDLHWVDTLSYDLLIELARAVPDSPVCFVLACRPPRVTQMDMTRIENLPTYTQIELHEFTVAEATQAARAKLAQLSPQVAAEASSTALEQLTSRAQGNPFYLEELLNFVHERGLDLRTPHALADIELPDSLHTLILSRIDQLSEHEKNALRVASIIGRLFRVEWLAGYYPELGQIESVKVTLAQLAKVEITPLDTPEPELAYLFKHIITHAVTYESLPFALRTRLHERLAVYLEAAAEATHNFAPFLDVITAHYLRSDNHAKQREYLRKAAHAAQAVSAFAAAAHHLTRLLALIPPTDPDHSATALHLAEAHYFLSDFPAARAVLQQAYTAATTDGERAAALALLGEMTSEIGNYAEAQRALTEAVPLARTSRDPYTLCRALSALGAQCCRLGQFEEAQSSLQECLDLARAIDAVTYELFALTRLGIVAGQQGDLEKSNALFQTVLARALDTGNRERAMAAYNNLSMGTYLQQDYQGTRAYQKQAFVLAQEIGAQEAIAQYYANIAECDIRLGRLADARTGLRAGLALSLRLGAHQWVVAALMGFANLAYAEGQYDQALSIFGLARCHSAWNNENQMDFDQTLAQWGLDAARVEAGLQQGAQLDLEATFQELLHA